jgi:hypothetical protein
MGGGGGVQKHKELELAYNNEIQAIYHQACLEKYLGRLFANKTIKGFESLEFHFWYGPN